MEHIEKIFSAPKVRFQRHLDLPHNYRIIFSGMFGIGKSYFLKRFFSLEENEDYEVIRIAPVNYSIATNEDILKYIKYDLLCELIAKGMQVEELDLDLSHYLVLYLQKNWKKIGKAVLMNVAKLSKVTIGGVEVFDAIVEFFKSVPEFEKFKEGLNNQYNEGDLFATFMDEVEGENSLYDNTIITKLIDSKIKALKNDGKKKTVLIIDDLDRIDPEHIFRIMNVFAAHFEREGYGETLYPERNKFNFDKVILVCDINNIRSIFHSKFGANVDFSGYIDKFYSQEIFNFDIRGLIISMIEDIRSMFFLEDSDLANRLVRGDQMIHYFVKAFFRKNMLNLRSFLKFSEEVHKIGFREVDINGVKIHPKEFNLLWQIILLSKIFGDRRNFLMALDKIDVKDFYDDRFSSKKVFDNFLILATIDQHRGYEKHNVSYAISESVRFEFTYSNQAIHNFEFFSNGLEHEFTTRDRDLYLLPLIKRVVEDFILSDVI